MAFYSVLRRTSTTALPLVTRNVGSRRALCSAISTVLLSERRSVSHDISRRSSLWCSRFSTATDKKPSADESLIRVIHSEIDCVEPIDACDVPDGFPFQINDNTGQRTILLTRQFEDETIEVEVDIPHVSVDEEDDNDDADDNTDSSNSSSIPLVVNISKESGKCLEFGITAFPDEISIDSLSIRNPENSDDQLAYEGPDFNDLDENLQKAFLKYLEIRGIKPSTTNFLFEYMQNKDHKEYLKWLENLKNFVEK